MGLPPKHGPKEDVNTAILVAIFQQLLGPLRADFYRCQLQKIYHSS